MYVYAYELEKRFALFDNQIYIQESILEKHYNQVKKILNDNKIK